MTATIIQLRDYQNPKDLARMYSEQTLEQQAIAIMAASLDPGMMGLEFGADDIIYESSLGFVAPEKDPA